jgi:predicted nucleic acid-binding protein
MSKGLLDSSVLIDCLRGRGDAVAFLAAHSAGVRPATHVMVAAELIAGARDKREQELIESFLESFEIVPPNESDALTALELYKRFHLSHGVDWPDCQIAATAQRLGVDVQTQNMKHFSAFPGVRAARAY